MIVGLLSENDSYDVHRQLGEFYTDDIEVLNQLKEAWVFTETSTAYFCDYYYTIELRHSGKVLETFEVNLACNVIETDSGYFYFDAAKLLTLKDHFKKANKKRQVFNTIQEGKKYLSKISMDKDLLLVIDPVWLKFEGKFIFTYKYSEKREDESNSIVKKIEAHIQEKYTNEIFAVARVILINENECDVELFCNKTLFEKLSEYSKDKNWTENTALLTTYWK